jgi:DNA polymerase-3 subunit delta'
VILGHVRQLRQLWEALARDALHHAILLEGPRGVGKRLVATRVAMAANCTDERPLAQRPCGKCRTCRAIEQGTHPDVLLLEPDPERAARTIPIEAVREVIRQTQYHRYDARRRFVIVDPAEAMQEPAANALLKTLEEPPEGTGFLLVTHNARALLPTILSRCHRMRFGAVPTDELRAWLEGRGVERADEVARLALGCPGRALELAGDGLAERGALRSSVLAAIAGPIEGIYELSQKLTQGARQEWAGGVDRLLEVVEDLLRDAAIRATEAPVPTLHPADGGLDRLAGLWPEGLERCARAVQDARDDLEVYVSGKTVIDALLAALRRELVSPS